MPAINPATKDQLRVAFRYLIFILLTLAGLFIFYNTFGDDSIPKEELLPKRLISLTGAYFFGMGGILFYILKRDVGKVNQHISHHLNTIIIKGSSRKKTALFFACTGFVMLGYILITFPDYFERGNHYVKIGVGVLSMVFFGLGLMISFVRFFRNSSQIIITDKGISVHAQWRNFSYDWNDIDTFQTFEIKSNKMISIILSESGAKKRKQFAFVKKINQAVSGDIRPMESITADVFDIGHFQLLDLLNIKLTAYKSKQVWN